MEFPFDPKDLVLRLKGQGLDIAEDAAKLVASSVLEWVSDSVLLSESKFDDFALAVIPVVKEFVLRELDKLDGEQG